jgi:protein SCO1/2
MDRRHIGKDRAKSARLLSASAEGSPTRRRKVETGRSLTMKPALTIRIGPCPATRCGHASSKSNPAIKPVVPQIDRARHTFGVVLAIALFAILAVTGPARAWNSTDMTGTLPALDFKMTRALDGKAVTAADYKGKIVLLYFGYTYCPDVCPTTLFNIAQMLKKLGKRADDVRVLFVTVDPNRDTLPVLTRYTEAFGSQVVGLRGTPDQLATLAKRYRVAYSVQPASAGHPYEVTHSAAVYVFDRNGNIKLLFSGLAAPGVPIAPITSDLQQIVYGTASGWWRRILGSL